MSKKNKNNAQEVQVEEVSKEEVIANEAPKEQAQPTPAKQATQSIVVIKSLDDVKALLDDETKPATEKLNLLAQSSLPELQFVKNLLLYQEQMSKEVTAPSDDNGSNNNRSLFVTLRRILDEVDYNLFKVQFDIVNLVFLVYSDDAYSEFRLHRYDMKWSGTYKQLKTYQKLVTVIATLCDKTTRAEKLRSISLSKMIDAQTTTFTDTNRSSILRYYSIA